jgi:hypothetical protein
MTSVTKVARFSGLLLASLSTGVLFGTRVALGPSSKAFATKTYVEVQQATVRNLRPVMGTLMPGAVAANLAVLGLSKRQRHSAAFALTATGFFGNLAALVLTGVFELPINARVLTWSADDPPEGWEGAMERWQAVHTARTAASVVGLGALAAAALVPGTTSVRRPLPDQKRIKIVLE